MPHPAARQAEDFQQTRLTGGPGGASKKPMKTLQRLGKGENARARVSFASDARPVAYYQEILPPGG